MIVTSSQSYGEPLLALTLVKRVMVWEAYQQYICFVGVPGRTYAMKYQM